ncbi:MAG: GNAT family N-acetyltransferase [Desmonostoc geniculatum HA4340-LM1]|jgi:RimJ/RimL family protein N-acetyltransferase|nr:GNAT family N-acetyltransferase [Desmonostoc geniculatum HA4340-LM1]
MENLVTTRLYLVPLTLEVVKVAIMGNDELASFLGVTVLPNWQDDEFIKNLPMVADILCKYPFQSEWGWGSLIIHKAENTLIGHVMVKVIPDATGLPTGSLEIGYHITPSYRQQGYASEATKAVVDWALSQPSVQNVTAGCDPNNIPSKRVLEKIGMQLIESRPKVLVWKLCKTASRT